MKKQVFLFVVALATVGSLFAQDFSIPDTCVHVGWGWNTVISYNVANPNTTAGVGCSSAEVTQVALSGWAGSFGLLNLPKIADWTKYRSIELLVYPSTGTQNFNDSINYHGYNNASKSNVAVNIPAIDSKTLVANQWQTVEIDLTQPLVNSSNSSIIYKSLSDTNLNVNTLQFFRLNLGAATGNLYIGAITLKAFKASISASATSISSGSTVTLTASGDNSYIWSTGATTAAITVNPLKTTKYSVTGTNTFGNTDTASILINVQAVKVSITPTVATINPGENVTLTASGATTYAWSTGATTASITVSPSATTTYSVTGTTGGITDSASITVKVQIKVSITPTVATINLGESVTLTANGATSYVWSTGATTASITVSPSATTIYSVTGTTGGITDTVSVTVTVNIIPTIDTIPLAAVVKGWGWNVVITYNVTNPSITAGVGCSATTVTQVDLSGYCGSFGIGDTLGFDFNNIAGLSKYKTLELLVYPTTGTQYFNDTIQIHGFNNASKSNVTVNVAGIDSNFLLANQWQVIDIDLTKPLINSANSSITYTSLGDTSLNINLIQFFRLNLNAPTGTLYIGAINLSEKALTGIKINTEENGIKLFPNPANSIVTIAYNSSINAKINIKTITGIEVRSVIAQAGSEQTLVDVNGLPAGIYIVTIQTPQGVVSKKLSIK